MGSKRSAVYLSGAIMVIFPFLSFDMEDSFGFHGNKTEDAALKELLNITTSTFTSNQINKSHDPVSSVIENINATSLSNFFIAVLGTGAIASLVTFVGNSWIKKREEEVDMSKRKMEMMVSVMPLYSQLASHYSSLSTQLSKIQPNDNEDEKKKQTKDISKVDISRVFFSVCKIYHIRKLMAIQKGVYMLDNRSAEDILVEFRRELDKSIDLTFSRLERSKIESLVQNEKEYEVFYKELKLAENRKLYSKFRMWLEETDEDVLKNIENRSKWFYEIFYLEVNSMFYRWYKSQPTIDSLSQELQDFIEHGYKDPIGDKSKDNEILYNSYYKRLKKFRRKRFKIIPIKR
jgi:hypothetical protein